MIIKIFSSHLSVYNVFMLPVDPMAYNGYHLSCALNVMCFDYDPYDYLKASFTCWWQVAESKLLVSWMTHYNYSFTLCRHLVWIYSLVFLKSVWNMRLRVFLQNMILCPLNIYLLLQMHILFFCKLIMAPLIYIPNNDVQGLHFVYILSDICYLFENSCSSKYKMVLQWTFIVLLCILLMINDAEMFFM